MANNTYAILNEFVCEGETKFICVRGSEFIMADKLYSPDKSPLFPNRFSALRYLQKIGVYQNDDSYNTTQKVFTDGDSIYYLLTEQELIDKINNENINLLNYQSAIKS